MLCGRNSHVVTEMNYAFETILPQMLATLTILPADFLSSGRKALHMRICPMRLTSIVLQYSSSEMYSHSPYWNIPALFTSPHKTIKNEFVDIDQCLRFHSLFATRNITLQNYEAHQNTMSC